MIPTPHLKSGLVIVTNYNSGLDQAVNICSQPERYKIDFRYASHHLGALPEASPVVSNASNALSPPSTPQGDLRVSRTQKVPSRVQKSGSRRRGRRGFKVADKVKEAEKLKNDEGEEGGEGEPVE